MTHPRSKINLIIATAFGLTAAVANSETQAQTTTPTNATQRVQVLRIVEASAAIRPQSKSLAEKKKLTLRKVVRHKSAAAHKLMRTTSPDPATRNADSPIWPRKPENLAREISGTWSSRHQTLKTALVCSETRRMHHQTPRPWKLSRTRRWSMRSKLTSLKRPPITTTTPFSQCWRR